jgi:hypothetical protein
MSRLRTSNVANLCYDDDNFFFFVTLLLILKAYINIKCFSLLNYFLF